VLVTARDVHEKGASWVLEQLPRGKPWFITIDCDGLDLTIAPGTGYPLPGGLTFVQASELVRGLTTTGPVLGMAFSEHYPSRDVRSLTGLTMIRLMMLAMGWAARWRASASNERGTPV
jgi:agmatinase